tara:strand:- start:3306 stop:4385 length:1080 start_codon:yes stop_codon:yes gene_type:complete
MSYKTNLKGKIKPKGEGMKKEAYYEDSSYSENSVNYAEDEGLDNGMFEDILESLDLNEEEGVITDVFETGSFSENDFSEQDVEDLTLQQALESLSEGDSSLGDLAEELKETEEEVEELLEEHGDSKISDLIPGANISIKEVGGEEEAKETDYANDGDLSKFMEYIASEYPSNIPTHDGRTTVGCEKAISFLDRLNSQISRAVQDDVESHLDLERLEGIRGSIMRDVITLKDHLNNLKKKIKEQHLKKATKTAPLWVNADGEKVVLTKEAAIPNNLVIAITPFERAISGMMINAHVSAGKPMAEVYEALKEKYDLTDREELAILQICMDSGFPLFKDRGAASGKDKKDSLSVDFLKNYFA